MIKNSQYPLKDWFETITLSLQPGTTKVQFEAALRRLRIVAKQEAGHIPAGDIYEMVYKLQSYQEYEIAFRELRYFAQKASKAYLDEDNAKAYKHMGRAVGILRSVIPWAEFEDR